MSYYDISIIVVVVLAFIIGFAMGFNQGSKNAFDYCSKQIDRLLK